MSRGCWLDGDFGERVEVVVGGERPLDVGERLSVDELAGLLRRWLAEPESERRLRELHAELNGLAEPPVTWTRHQRDRTVAVDLARRFEWGSLEAYRVLRAEAPGGGRGRGAPGPQPPRAPGQPRPRDIVHPLIDIEPPVVLVDRPHRPVARRRVGLSTDVAFDGFGTFRCASTTRET